MIAGHLQEKRGYYHIVLNYTVEENGKSTRKSKWISTGLEVKGNKRKAEIMLQEARKNFQPEPVAQKDEQLFLNYLLGWVEIVKPNIVLSTYASYLSMAERVIGPYFKQKRLGSGSYRPLIFRSFTLSNCQRA